MAKDYNPSRRNREAFEALAETPGNVPPQAVELEEAVLGALMLEKDSIIAVQEYVTPDAFYTEEHRTIYKAIEELSMELKPIDLYTVTERLKGKKELKKVGGASYLAQLTQKVGSAANVEFHAKIIAQKYVQRELIRSATEIQKRSYDESTDVTELIGYAEGEIFKVAEGHVKRSVQVSKDILARALMQIEEASKNTSAFNGVPSGFMAIDRVTLGWQLSDLIIIAARPSMGKTAFVLSMARNMAVDHEQGVAFFSLEMSSVQLMMRLIIAETGLNGNDVKSGRLTPEQWRHLESATKPLGAAPLFIDDTPALSVFEFRSKARRLKIHNDIKIIIIDYLQLMTGNQDSKGNREQEVAFISRTLKAIAKELNVPVLAMGLHDVVISASPEGILVSDKEQSSYIKPYVDKIDQQIMFAEKSWGSFRVLDVEDESLTIKVTLNPGHSMNYHSHMNRDEVWVVISGTGRTVVDGVERPVHVGDVVQMQAGCRHTVLADSELQLIEVQLGKEISVHDKQKFPLEQETTR